MNAENLSQAQFADSIGVARASVSHILAGRNKPGFDFIERVARRFPSLNIDWFITGKGKMYKNASESIPGKVFESEPEAPQDDLFSADSIFVPEVKEPEQVRFASPQITESRTLVKHEQIIEPKKFITKVTVFYSDGTYKDL